MNDTVATEYASRVLNNLDGMMGDLTKHPNGNPRGMSDQVAAGVLVAQSNLAIAAALLVVAEAIRGGHE